MTELADILKQHQWWLVGNIGVPGMEDYTTYKCDCGWNGDDPRRHVAADLESMFVVLPKDQLHRETRIAEVIKTEMHRNVPERMRLPGIPEWIDRAAAAVLALRPWNYTGNGGQATTHGAGTPEARRSIAPTM